MLKLANANLVRTGKMLSDDIVKHNVRAFYGDKKLETFASVPYVFLKQSLILEKQSRAAISILCYVHITYSPTIILPYRKGWKEIAVI